MRYRTALKLLPLIVASMAVHAWLLISAWPFTQVAPFNDVLLYGYWLDTMPRNVLLGINGNWVYPYVALVPMALAKVIGGGAGILAGWVAMVGIINTLAICWLVQWGAGPESRFKAAWFWLAFLVVLGPVAIGRIDGIATAFALFGLIALTKNRIQLAAALFTAGAWMKIWPVAMALATFVSQAKKRIVVISAIAVSSGVLVAGLIMGGNAALFSFITMQSNRGIQIEAPVATFWIWASKLGAPQTYMYFDDALLTNQIAGGGVDLVSSLMTWAMFVALAITAWLGWRASKNTSMQQLISAVALTAVLDLIVFNKVGSPQFMAWLAVPTIAWIIFERAKAKTLIAAVLLIGLLTQLVYPLLYIDLMGYGWLSIATLTMRNVLLVVLLVWANLQLAALAKTKAN
ncbi:glycosyltransferase 87 family protein [Rhodoluna sp.]|uniref:glycosyltransferase 87 family protein n=1 Tax=Rhodoluna sp. TaxID=1969481 RepID=UPI0025E20E7B|nr:glycosyltransferase 87 family protein [Rhodoluna sp.]